jgi:hypothetical protein
MESEQKGKDKVGRPQQQGYEYKDFLKKAICNSKILDIIKKEVSWEHG